MSFDYSKIPVGYYDRILYGPNGIRKAWHELKFRRIRDFLETHQGQSILDVGCFAGSFLSMIPEALYARQVGIDILAEQVSYANDYYKRDFREFYFLDDLSNFESEDLFDVITLIEVIEHLDQDQIQDLFRMIHRQLKQGGKLIITTPNYSSLWPLIEFILNHTSSVSYEEQHLTKFTYFNFEKKLQGVVGCWMDKFEIEIKTTSHLLTPFLAGIFYSLALQASRTISMEKWKLPFGNLIICSLLKRR